MTTKVILFIFSNKAKELTDFYSEVFGGIIRLVDESSKEAYLYEFERSFAIQFIQSDSQSSKVELKIQVGSLKRVEEKLKELGTDIKWLNSKKKCLSILDSAGNVLYIEEYNRLKYIGMPIGG